jgi:hypothetical protein
MTSHVRARARRRRRLPCVLDLHAVGSYADHRAAWHDDMHEGSGAECRASDEQSGAPVIHGTRLFNLTFGPRAQSLVGYASLRRAAIGIEPDPGDEQGCRRAGPRGDEPRVRAGSGGAGSGSNAGAARLTVGAAGSTSNASGTPRASPGATLTAARATFPSCRTAVTSCWPVVHDSGESLGGRLRLLVDSGESLGGRLRLPIDSGESLGGRLRLPVDSGESLGGRLRLPIDSAESFHPEQRHPLASDMSQEHLRRSPTKTYAAPPRKRIDHPRADLVRPKRVA